MGKPIDGVRELELIDFCQIKGRDIFNTVKLVMIA